jgi:hypothetical protein
MKRILISAALLLSVMVCHAQWSTRGTVEISMGGSYPVGEFGYSTPTYYKSGFAKSGINFTLSFTYRVNAQLGLLASVSEHLLGVDELSIATRYWIPQYGWNWTVESSCWSSNAYMGGIDIILPVYKSDIQLRFLGGYAATRLPGLTGSAFGFQRKATTDIAGAWSAGVGFTYQYFEKITLSVMLDFFMTYPVLDEVWSSELDSGSGVIEQDILLVNLTVGLGLRVFQADAGK